MNKNIKGGKLLGEGAHGCVFDKELDCANDDNSIKIYGITRNRFKNNMVTKLSLDLGEHQRNLLEWDISTLIKSIPNYMIYFRIPVANCVATVNGKGNKIGETNAELNKCGIYTDTLKRKDLKYNNKINMYMISTNDDNKKVWFPFRLHFTEKADMDLSVYLKKLDKQNYLNLPFMIKNMVIGIKHIINISIVHSDIKLQNIMVNLKKTNLNNKNFINFYNNIPLARISDFGISKDTFIYKEKKVSSKNKLDYLENNYYAKYKFSYIILPPEFNIIAHLLRYHKKKTKTVLIKEIKKQISNNKLPFWDLNYIDKLINKIYDKNKLNIDKVYKYTKKYWNKFDIYSLGLMIYIIFINIPNNIIINTKFGIYDFNIIKNIFLELSINLCHMDPSKRYSIEKVEYIINNFIEKFIYNNNNSFMNNMKYSSLYTSNITDNISSVDILKDTSRYNLSSF